MRLHEIRNTQGLNVFEVARILLSYEDSPDDTEIDKALLAFSEIWTINHLAND